MLSETQIAALGKQILTQNGYEVRPIPETWQRREEAYLFEDEYSIVGMVIYSTSSELLKQWSEDQGILTRVITDHVGRGEAKAAEGYLVLLSSGAPLEQTKEGKEGYEDRLTRIRYDTSRVRKLVAIGPDLQLKADVERVLSPLLPLRVEQTEMEAESALAELPDLLDTPRAVTRKLLKAYREQTPLLETLHDYVKTS